MNSIKIKLFNATFSISLHLPNKGNKMRKLLFFTLIQFFEAGSAFKEIKINFELIVSSVEKTIYNIKLDTVG